MASRRLSLPRTFLSLILLASVAASGYADEPDGVLSSYRLRFGLGADLLWGVAEEIVYQGPSDRTLLSLLLWPMKPLALIGGEMNLYNDAARRSPYLRLSADASPPMHSGTMEDFDWLGASPDPTHYSFHENYTERFSSLRLELGLRLNSPNGFSVLPYAGGRLHAAYWSARDGYTVYPPDYQPLAVQGTGISYELRLLALSLGLGLELRPSAALSLAWRFELMPLVDVRAVDNHYLRDAIFEDYVYGSVGLSFGLDARLALSRSARLGFVASFLTIGGGRGDTIHRSTADPDIQPPPVVGIYYGQAGFAMTALSAGFRLHAALP